MESRLLLAVALADVKNVSLGATPKIFTGSLSASNLIDIYKFSATSAGPFNFDAKLTGVTSGDFDLGLVQDKNHNAALDNGEILDSSETRGVHDEHISHMLTTPDSYFVLVTRVTGTHSYSLSMSDTSTDTAGNTLATAKTLGFFGGSISTTNDLNEFVGPIDTADVFEFTPHGGEYRITLSPTNGSIAIDVINDANPNNDQIDPGETIATLAGGGVLDGVVGPTTGQAFLLVRPLVASNINYTFKLVISRETPFSGTPVSISATVPTKIEAENFDNGGDGFGYHDTDVANDNGAFRPDEDVDIKTTTDTDGGTDQSANRFRVTDTAVGEFLNYTINVAQAGNYDIDFRASSPATGAACHLEIDDTDVTGPVAIPNTGGFDAMTDVTRPAVPLTAGPHVMRLEFDAGLPSGANAGFAGSYNFIRLTPAASPGTFKLTPPQSTVAPGQSDKIAIKWTVPEGSWHLLDEIQLRLLSADGTRIKIKWNEAANTLRLYDNITRTFGPPKKIGSNAILSDKYVHIHLATSSVKASSSTSPTVTLTIDLRFTADASGKTFVLAASARDDLGHFAPFVNAGSIVVT